MTPYLYVGLFMYVIAQCEWLMWVIGTKVSFSTRATHLQRLRHLFCPLAPIMQKKMETEDGKQLDQYMVSK